MNIVEQLQFQEDKRSYDRIAHKIVFDEYVAEKYSNIEHSKVIWQREGKQIIKAFKNEFKYLTPQFKYRCITTRKFSLEYDDTEDLFFLEAPDKYKNKIRRQPIVFVEDIFDKIHQIHFDRAHTGRVKTNYQVNWFIF